MADEPQEKPVDTTKERPGCWRRALSCACWLLLAIFALLLVSYLVEVYRCSRFTPAGDALFDRYARAVIHRQAWRLFRGDGTHPATLPDDLLAEWEDDFGNDPRYWQLRYWCRLNSDYGPPWDWISYTSAPDTGAAYPFLEEARVRGISDAETLAIQYIVTLELLPQDYQVREDEFPGEMAILSAVLFELSDRSASYSWVHYADAFTRIRQLDYDGALAAIDSGNACSDNYWPSCFPQSVAKERCDQLDPINKALYGAILSAESGCSPIGWPSVKSTPEFFDWIAARDNASELSACHKFACRIGSAQGNTFGVRVAPTLLLQLAYSAMERNAADYTPEQRRVVLTLIDRVRRLQHTLGAYYAEAEAFEAALEPSGWTFTYACWIYFAPSHLDSPRLHRMANLYFWNHPDGWRLILLARSNELMQHRLYTWGEFDNMALLDYETLELPDDWWDIGAQNGFPERHPDWTFQQDKAVP